MIELDVLTTATYIVVGWVIVGLLGVLLITEADKANGGNCGYFEKSSGNLRYVLSLGGLFVFGMGVIALWRELPAIRQCHREQAARRKKSKKKR